MEAESLPVQGSPLWPQPLASHLYQGVEATAEVGSQERYSHNGLSRRSSNHGHYVSTIATIHQHGMSQNDRVGMVDQLREIFTNTCSSDLAFRNEYQHHGHGDFSSGQEDPKYSQVGSPAHVSTRDTLVQVSTVYRNRSGHISGEPAGTVSDKAPPQPAQSDTAQALNSCDPGHANGTALVGHSTDQVEWATPTATTADSSNLYRCVRHRIRPGLEQQSHCRQVDSSRTPSPHQCEGATGNREDLRPHLNSSSIPSTALHGQHQRHCQRTEIRRDEVRSTQRRSHEDLETLLQTLDTTLNPIRPVETESSRRSIESNRFTNRMAISSGTLPTTGQDLGTAFSGSFCLSSEPPSPLLCDVELPSGCLDYQCIESGLGNNQGQIVSQPTVESPNSDCDEIETDEEICNTAHTELALGALVPYVAPADSQSSLGTTRTEAPRRKRTRPSDEESVLVTASLEHTPPLAKRVSYSRSKLISQRQEKFVEWLYDRGEEDTPIKMPLILSYIQERSAQLNWSFNTCCQYIGHISLMYPVEIRQQLKAHHEFLTYVKNGKSTNVRPFKHFNYNIQLALQHLLDLGPNLTLSIKDLTAKLAWLISMAGFLRPSDLARIDIDKTTFTAGDILHLVVVGPKEKRRGQPIWRSVAIHPHDNPLLCPVEIYKDYCKRVASSPCVTPHPYLENTTTNALVRSTISFSMALSPERISKYVQSVMEHVERIPSTAPVPKARALGATLAALNGLSVDQIVAHGNWSSRSIFEDFYRISVANNTNFTSSTLEVPQSSSSKCNIM